MLLGYHCGQDHQRVGLPARLAELEGTTQAIVPALGQIIHLAVPRDRNRVANRHGDVLSVDERELIVREGIRHPRPVIADVVIVQEVFRPGTGVQRVERSGQLGSLRQRVEVQRTLLVQQRDAAP
jgi:hypothetical protein